MDVAPILPHLANTRLTDLTLQLTMDAKAVIDIFRERCPAVENFHVSLRAHGHAETISDLVCNWQKLRSVQCFHIHLTVDAITHLARSRHLVSLHFRLDDAVIDQIGSSLSLQTFSVLRDLNINSPSLTLVRRFLHHLRAPVVQDIFVGLHAHPTASELMAFPVVLQETCTSNSLITLLLRVFEDRNQSTTVISTDNSLSYYLTFEGLGPLTSFVNIQSIILDLPCGTDLNQRELLSLASSWPRLEHFEVARNRDWTSQSAITPAGFVQLLERCRSLRTLYFMFDTRGFTEIPQGHPWRGVTMPKGSFIHLLNSPIEEESIVALGVFFHVAPYPSFNLTTHWNNPFYQGRERPQELCDLYYNRWVKARALASDLWKERKELRRSLEERSKSHL